MTSAPATSTDGVLAAKERRERREIHTVSANNRGSTTWVYWSCLGETNPMKTINELCNVVRQTAYAVHVYHGHGHLEKVYENALVNRLRKAGYEVQQQHPIRVLDADGTVIGEYLADLLIEGCLIIELKAVKTVAEEHVAQLLGYLKSTRTEHGLLINFGSYKFQIKKYALSQLPRFPISSVCGLIPFFALLAFFRG